MTKGLSSREKRLLGACVAVLLISATTLLAKEFLDRRAAVEKTILGLESEKRDNDTWLKDRDFQASRKEWLEANLPTTESLGRAQGQLLEEFQNAALDRGLRILNSQLPAAHSTANYQEVAVTLKVYGEQAKVLAWLATIQSPERFYVIKALELDPDSRTREPLPQIECDVTIARWFKPDGTATEEESPD
jgi:hypothetical protein